MPTETTPERAKAPELLRLDGHHNQNWSPYAGPVAVLNEASTLHERIAYCWGLAQQMLDMSELFIDSSDESLNRLSCHYATHLKPLVAMLDNLGDSTRP